MKNPDGLFVALALVATLGFGASMAQGTKPEQPARAAAAAPAAAQSVERGRYLVAIAGCNDCHTPRYPETAGAVPVSDWLVGSPVGFQGPWGTTYPSNLRLVVQDLSEQQWLEFARAPRRPPMPWFALRDMSDADLRAMYRFIRKLGPAGGRAPAAVAPGEAVTTPFIPFVPQNPPAIAARR